jgi:hypothetical protein
MSNTRSGKTFRGISATLITMTLAAIPSTSFAGPDDSFAYAYVSGNNAGLSISATADDHEGGSVVIPKRYLDIKGVKTSVRYTGTGKRYTIKYKLTIVLEGGKKFTYGSKGFALINNNKTCESPEVLVNNRTARQEYLATDIVCHGNFGTLGLAVASAASFTIAGDIVVAGTSYPVSKTWKEILVYDR